MTTYKANDYIGLGDDIAQAGGLRTGVGLGLAIAKEIVLAHSGEIKVSSNPGEKTKFTVTLTTRLSN